MWNGTVTRSMESFPHRLSGADRTVRVEVELDGERHFFDWPSTGDCSMCNRPRLRAARESVRPVNAGSWRMAANLVFTNEDLANGYVLPCQAKPVSGLVRICYD